MTGPPRVVDIRHPRTGEVLHTLTHTPAAPPPCWDCAHFRADWVLFPNVRFAICGHPDTHIPGSKRPDLGPGATNPASTSFCSSARQSYGQCRPEAWFFEPAPEGWAGLRRWMPAPLGAGMLVTIIGFTVWLAVIAWRL